MKRLSLYKLIKKYKTYCHVSIFFNARFTKRIRFGYRFYQKTFKDAKRLKFLKINVRQPRLPVRRKTKYGKILEQRQKLIYILDSGRRSAFFRIIQNFYRLRTSSLNSFFNFASINPFFFCYSFGFAESPSFQKFFDRYYLLQRPISKSVQAFRTKTSTFFYFPNQYWLYFLSVFNFRAQKNLIFYYFNQKNFFFNLYTFGLYPFSTKGFKGVQSARLYGNRNAFPKTFLRFH